MEKEPELNNLVVDANVIFSALIKRGVAFDLLIQLPARGVRLHSPEFLWEEVWKSKEKLLKFSGLTEKRLEFFISVLSNQLETVTKDKYEKHVSEAKNLLKQHVKDVVYFSLALSLECPIWSNEKRFSKQSNIKIYSSADLFLKFIKKN